MLSGLFSTHLLVRGADQETGPDQETGDDHETQPNFIIFFPDDFGMNDVGYTNNLAPIPTPNLDELAKEGIILDNWYTGPICTPSRCALMTGRHIMRNGCHGDIENNAWGLNLDEVLIPEVLNSAGYYSVIYGKWHLGHYSWQHTPMYRGFDEWRGFLGGATGMDSHQENGTYDWWNGVHIDTSAYMNFSTYLLDSYLKKLIYDTASGLQNQPFFAYIPIQVPNGPLGAPLEWTTLYEDRWGNDSAMTSWLAELSMLDWAVGQARAHLEGAGIDENTYIIFAGDHGAPEYYPANLNYSRDHPFSYGKHTIWEGGVRCPAFIWNPNLEARVISTPTSVVDFLPTIASLAGISRCDLEWDGVDLSQYFQDDSGNEKRVLLIDCDIGCNVDQEFGEDDEEWMKQPKAAIRYMNYKLMSHCVTVEDGVVVSSNKTYFFDVVHDVQEKHNYAEFIDPHNTDFPYYDVYWFMMDALKAYALEAHHQFPDDEPQIWCESCTNLCGNEEVDGLVSLRP